MKKARVARMKWYDIWLERKWSKIAWLQTSLKEETFLLIWFIESFVYTSTNDQ